MSDEKPAQSTVAQPAEPAPAAAAGTTGKEGASSETVAPITDAKATDSESKPKSETKSEPAADNDDEAAKVGEDKAAEKPAEAEETEAKTEPAPADADPEPQANEKTSEADVDMKDKPAEEAAEPATDAKAEAEKSAEATTNAETEDGTGADAADTTAVEAEETSPGADKSKARRKSSAAADHAKGKKLNKKASKAKILHLDAKPGDHYFAKLKGFPPWPVIVCEEDMLPQNMLNSRPVTAARPDGTYREDFADGGRRAADRTYPVMYLYTNEFSWTPNTDLSELDAETVTDLITPKMRKDLQSAHQLAAEQNDLDYYKNVLREFEEQRLAKLEAKNNKKKTPKKASKASEAAADEDGDIEMADAEEGGEGETSEKKSKSKKRKAEEENHSTPQRSDSVKKPKIKLTNSSTPKAANGVQSPSVAKDSSRAKGKTKSKAKDADSKKEKEQAAPKEPELTPEEKQLRKEKEILFLRHRLQKGLLLRDQEPKSEEMKSMSDFLGKLETFPDLEVSIIRATKINKVLKAILRLETIPKESDFEFKPRSQALLDKWNKLLAVDGGAPAAANGVNGTSGAHAKGEKETNGEKATKAEAKAETDKDTSKAGSCEKDTKEGSEANAESSNEDKPTATEVQS
ncbi:hypothetical protein F4775DRAFT_574303 [Biscogniauxia sp. FL1348]|nr:hypothetical protein F4775DRAFT_574303 [Biscogniauxia sp. FL1348]